MKHFVFAAVAFAALSLANPIDKRQDIDFAAYNAVPTMADLAAPAGNAAPTTVTYDASSVASAAAAAATSAGSVGVSTGSNAVVSKHANRKRSACSVQMAGIGPTVRSPDTADAFQRYDAFARNAKTVSTPVGYRRVVTNALASAQDSTYLTYTMLSAYDPTACATFCQRISGCNSFNICESCVSTDSEVKTLICCQSTSETPQSNQERDAKTQHP